jgi:sialate O-acetylesterase
MRPLLWFLIMLTTAAWADVTLPSVFSPRMVLQQGRRTPVWGWATPGEQVAVTLGRQTVHTRAGSDGAWRVALRNLKAGGPYTLTVAGANTLTIPDVLVGEVWVCSGQSNMQMLVAPSARSWIAGGVENHAQAVAGAHTPTIRMLTVPFDDKTMVMTPKRDSGGAWVVCSPNTVGAFAAVPYFFGRRLQRELRVPIGLLNVSLGGSGAEAWVSRETYQRESALKPLLARWDQSWATYQAALKTTTPPVNPMSHRTTPTALYNGMLAPLIPYAMRGVIWYQGESNVERAGQYHPLFSALIADWRRQWGQGDFPFLYVQLAPIGANTVQSPWALLREAQLRTLAVPNTAMTVITDLDHGLHPLKKGPVGERLALSALALAYHRKLEYAGPLYQGVTREGAAMRLRFTHTGKGLTATGGTLKGFLIAGANCVFVPADARIDGTTVVVSSPKVPAPAAVRYGWADGPLCNLANANGLPASPFRTDHWTE